MKYLDALFDLFLKEFDAKDLIALGILVAQFALLVWVLRAAQRRPDFDVANFLRDENGKESSTRAFAFVALGIMSWAVAMLIFMDKMTADYFFFYGVLWAGTPVALELAKKWNGSLAVTGGSHTNTYNPPPLASLPPPEPYARYGDPDRHS